MIKSQDNPASLIESDTDISSLVSRAGRNLEKNLVDIRKVKQSQTRNINLQARDLIDLIQKFLSELLYLEETYQLVFSQVDVQINERNVSLSGQLKGERLDKSRHQQKNPPKSPERKDISLKKDGKSWQLEVKLSL